METMTSAQAIEQILTAWRATGRTVDDDAPASVYVASLEFYANHFGGIRGTVDTLEDGGMTRAHAHECLAAVGITPRLGRDYV